MDTAIIDEAKRLLRAAAHPVSFSGAGLSSESGIATFRDPVEGLWSRYDPMKLASREGFTADPELVISWYRERRRAASAAGPNPAHRALAAWPDAIHVTQNVDDLLERAGVQDVIHLHGRLGFDRCDDSCGYRSPADPGGPIGLQRCPACGAMLRPDVVWFGESLDPNEWERATIACERADLMVVVGTSGAVYPAASLVRTARSAGAAIIVVDPIPTDLSGLADLVLTGNAGSLLPAILPSPA